jgi:hypothetical protein
MLHQTLYIITLFAYSLVLSQHFFYWLAMTRASKRLSAGAYIEIRQQIDASLQLSLRVSYYGCLIVCSLLLLFSFSEATGTEAVLAGLAWLALAADIVISMKGNVPINKVINQWRPDAYPANWQDYRQRWFRIYRIRQWSAAAGFIALLLMLIIG